MLHIHLGLGDNSQGQNYSHSACVSLRPIAGMTSQISALYPYQPNMLIALAHGMTDARAQDVNCQNLL